MHNPNLTALDEQDPNVEWIDCEAACNGEGDGSPIRRFHGFLQYFNMLPEVRIKPSHFRGDIHLSRKEKSWFSQVQELTREKIPFWLVSTGSEDRASTNRWGEGRFQAIVNEFKDRILFVQVGTERDHSSELDGVLDGVIDLRGKTDLRQLIRLVHHAQGVLCPVNLLMHLAAAVETGSGAANRACVVIAGGSHPPQWQRYPTHQYLHTIGALPCCESTGCGRRWTHSPGGSSMADSLDDICVDTIGDLAHCMQMIGEPSVITAIGRYFDGGLLNFLSSGEVCVARATVEAIANRAGHGLNTGMVSDKDPVLAAQDRP